jgi:hypothetical protein
MDEQFREWMLTCSSAMSYEGIADIAPVYSVYYDKYRAVLAQYLDVLNLTPCAGIVVFRPTLPPYQQQVRPSGTLGFSRNRLGDNFLGVSPSDEPSAASPASLNLAPEFVLADISIPSPQIIVEKALRAASLEDAFDILFEEFDDLFQAEHFQEVDQVLMQLPLENYSSDIIAGIVASTRPARQRLPSWPKFLEKAKDRVKNNDPANLIVLEGF